LANSASVSGSESNVARLTPSGTPRVSDDPRSVITISDGGDTVVDTSTAVAEYTGRIELPVGGIDGDGNGLAVEGGLEAVTVVDVSESGDAELGGSSLASLVSGGVAVIVLAGDTLGNDVLEGVVHPTTVASLVSETSAAVD